MNTVTAESHSHFTSLFSVEPAPSPQVTPVNTFLSNSLVTDLEGLSLSDTVLSPAVSIHTFLIFLFIIFSVSDDPIGTIHG